MASQFPKPGEPPYLIARWGRKKQNLSVSKSALEAELERSLAAGPSDQARHFLVCKGALERAWQQYETDYNKIFPFFVTGEVNDERVFHENEHGILKLAVEKRLDTIKGYLRPIEAAFNSQRQVKVDHYDKCEHALLEFKSRLNEMSEEQIGPHLDQYDQEYTTLYQTAEVAYNDLTSFAVGVNIAADAAIRERFSRIARSYRRDREILQNWRKDQQEQGEVQSRATSPLKDPTPAKEGSPARSTGEDRLTSKSPEPSGASAASAMGTPTPSKQKGAPVANEWMTLDATENTSVQTCIRNPAVDKTADEDQDSTFDFNPDNVTEIDVEVADIRNEYAKKRYELWKCLSNPSLSAKEEEDLVEQRQLLKLEEDFKVKDAILRGRVARDERFVGKAQGAKRQSAQPESP